MGIDRSSSAHFGSDFNVYYTSGVHFSEGESLYANPNTGAPYLYPPFAAFLFQILTFFPQGMGVGTVFVANFFLTALSAWLVFAIAVKLNWQAKQAGLALLGALIISITDVWNNVNFSQINTLIFTLTLAGIYAYISEKRNLAMVFWSFGAWIKVLPVMFIIWGLIRNPKSKYFLAVFAVSIMCVGLPIVQRGWNLGVHDLFDYYHHFLETNMGGANIIWRNQSLSAALMRAFIPVDQLEFLDVEWSKHVVRTSALWIKVCSVLTILLAFGITALRKLNRLPITVIELALIYLATHLFSGITWRGHLLTTMFIFVPLIQFKEEHGLSRLVRVALVLYLAVVFLAPKGLLGGDFIKELHLLSLPTWGLLALYGYFVGQLCSEFQFRKSSFA